MEFIPSCLPLLCLLSSVWGGVKEGWGEDRGDRGLIEDILDLDYNITIHISHCDGDLRSNYWDVTS